MDARRLMTRRNVVRGIAAVSAAASCCFPVLPRAQAAARIVVIGGGFAGATCARAMKRLERNSGDAGRAEPDLPRLPFSNDVIVGLRDIKEQQFGYDKVAQDGVDLVFAQADGDRSASPHGDARGRPSLTYDRLVLAPGIDLRFDALPGYDEEAAEKMPHAWKAGEQTLLLRRNSRRWTMAASSCSRCREPFRCPPGALRTRQPDRALSEGEQAALQGHHSRRQGCLSEAAAVRERLEGALSRHDRTGVAVAGRARGIGRSRDQHVRHRFRQLQGRRSPTSSRRRRPAASPTSPA